MFYALQGHVITQSLPTIPQQGGAPSAHGGGVSPSPQPPISSSVTPQHTNTTLGGHPRINHQSSHESTRSSKSVSKTQASYSVDNAKNPSGWDRPSFSRLSWRNGRKMFSQMTTSRSADGTGSSPAVANISSSNEGTWWLD